MLSLLRWGVRGNSWFRRIRRVKENNYICVQAIYVLFGIPIRAISIVLCRFLLLPALCSLFFFVWSYYTTKTASLQEKQFIKNRHATGINDKYLYKKSKFAKYFRELWRIYFSADYFLYENFSFFRHRNEEIITPAIVVIKISGTINIPLYTIEYSHGWSTNRAMREFSSTPHETVSECQTIAPERIWHI